MEMRHAVGKNEYMRMTTHELRNYFLGDTRPTRTIRYNLSPKVQLTASIWEPRPTPISGPFSNIFAKVARRAASSSWG